VLFGGNTTKDMKQKFQILPRRPLADFLPTVTIAAKNFATEITNFNVKNDDLQGEFDITDEHVRNNTRVRGVLLEDDIVPEELPAEEDIKKIQRKVHSEDKVLAKLSKRR
jgi:DNA-damage-inducible protein D